jgi:FAD-linked oxidoreductase
MENVFYSEVKMPVTWRNWSGSVQFKAQELHYPESEEEICQILKIAGRESRKVRVVGSGHSFTPLVQTSGYLISLDKYSGIISVDRENCRVTIKAGTKIKQLGALLFEQGMAQPNLGDIDEQSIAGAISTGTHGSGMTLGGLATQVEALRLVTASGEGLECSAEKNPEIFKAAQVSLGALGVISEVTLKLVPAYKLRYVWGRQSLDDCLANLEEYRRVNRNFEFFWFPHTHDTLVKFMNQTDEPPLSKNLLRRANELVLENGVFWLFSEFCRFFPVSSAFVARLCGKLISGGSDINYSYKMYATPRLVKFQEMEYNLPVEHIRMALLEIDELITVRKFRVHFPIECRFVSADDIYLSPSYGRESAYIAVHMYRGMEYKGYFGEVEKILVKYGGRPHWGKLHNLNASDFKKSYPRWDNFLDVRAQLDPNGLFLNDYLKRLFGLT